MSVSGSGCTTESKVLLGTEGSPEASLERSRVASDSRSVGLVLHLRCGSGSLRFDLFSCVWKWRIGFKSQLKCATDLVSPKLFAAAISDVISDVTWLSECTVANNLCSLSRSVWQLHHKTASTFICSSLPSPSLPPCFIPARAAQSPSSSPSSSSQSSSPSSSSSSFQYSSSSSDL